VLTVPARTGTRWATYLLVLVLAVLWPVLGSNDLAIVGVAVGYAIAAIGVDISTGYAGQPNFGQSAFMATGAFATAWLQNTEGLSLWLALLCSLAICAAMAVVLGLAAVRLEHLGFGIVTFAFAFVVAAWVQGSALTSITGGPNGVPAPDGELFGIDLTNPRNLYGVSVVLLAIVALLAHNLVASRTGRAMLTVKGDERVAEVLGVRASSIKLRAFAFSAVCGGLGGALIAISAGYVTPASFPPAVSVTVFGMVALGGVGTITGPVLGAMFFWLVPNYAPGLESKQTVFVAAIFLVVLIVMPAGAFGAAADLMRERRLPTWLRSPLRSRAGLDRQAA
jgi:branched-chain amino acid transport system permease protein